MNALVAGVDCSTQRTKVVVVDAASGKPVASGSAPHQVVRRGVRSETDPEVWWSALTAALAETGCAADIAAIGVAAQQLGLVVLDGAGRPLRPAILWDDTRADKEAIELEDALGGGTAWIDAIGSRPRPGMTVTSWAWLRRHEPEVAASTASVRLPHDYLVERLTGSGVTDRGDASGTGWWSGLSEGYVDAVLDTELVRLDHRRLPRVLGPEGVAGSVTSDASSITGLRAGTPVSVGTGDNMAAALALAIEPGEPVISLGTSGTIYARSSRPSADMTGRVFAQASASGDHLPLGCTLNATLAVDRMAALLGIGRDDVPERTNVVVMPYFGGERLPDYPTAAGTIAGLRHDSSAGDMLLATYEGVIASLLDAIDVLDENSSGIATDASILLIGGGSQGAIWRQTLQRLAGRSILVPRQQELVAWGAAAQAAALIEPVSAIDVARRWDVRAGDLLPAREPDLAQLQHIARVRDAAGALNRLDVWA